MDFNQNIAQLVLHLLYKCAKTITYFYDLSMAFNIYNADICLENLNFYGIFGIR